MNLASERFGEIPHNFLIFLMLILLFFLIFLLFLNVIHFYCPWMWFILWFIFFWVKSWSILLVFVGVQKFLAVRGFLGWFRGIGSMRCLVDLIDFENITPGLQTCIAVADDFFLFCRIWQLIHLIYTFFVVLLFHSTVG